MKTTFLTYLELAGTVLKDRPEIVALVAKGHRQDKLGCARTVAINLFIHCSGRVTRRTDAQRGLEVLTKNILVAWENEGDLPEWAKKDNDEVA